MFSHGYSNATVKINSKTLRPRDWPNYKWGGSREYPLSGFSDAVYLPDFEKHIKDKAGTDGSIMDKTQFQYMTDTRRLNFQNRLDEISRIANPTGQDNKEQITIMDSLLKDNHEKTENDKKATRVINLVMQDVSNEVQVFIQPTLLEFSSEPAQCLQHIWSRLAEKHPFDVKMARLALDQYVKHTIGMATTPEELGLLVTALISEQQHAERILCELNPEVERRRLGLIGNQVRITAYNTSVAGYLAAKTALNPLAGPPNPLPVPQLEFVYPMPLAESARGAVNALGTVWMAAIDDGVITAANVVGVVPSFVLNADMLPPVPPTRSLIDPEVRLWTDLQWLTELRDKTESSEHSEVASARLLITGAMKTLPTPSLVEVNDILMTHTRTNTKSINHVMDELHAAHARAQGRPSTFVQSRQAAAHNAQMGDQFAYQPQSHMMYESMSHSSQGSGSSSANAQQSSMEQEQGYGSQIRALASVHANVALSKREVDNMSDSELLKRVREEAAREPIPGEYSTCHYWGVQADGRLYCMAESVLGRPCRYRDRHDPSTTAPPAKRFSTTASVGGQFLRPPGQL